MMGTSGREAMKMFAHQNIPLGRYGYPEEIANMLRFWLRRGQAMLPVLFAFWGQAFQEYRLALSLCARHGESL